MDLLRPGAIPALTLLAAAAGAAPLAQADCSALDGTFAYESAAPRDGQPDYLSNLTMAPERRRLFRSESTGGPKGLASGQPMSRPKVVHLATMVAVAYHPSGTKFRFLDAEGKPIVELGIDYPDRWKCVGARLQRKSERTAGTAYEIRTDRVEQTLSRNAAGDLVFAETVTTIDPPGRQPKRSEATFKRVRASG